MVFFQRPSASGGRKEKYKAREEDLLKVDDSCSSSDKCFLNTASRDLNLVMLRIKTSMSGVVHTVHGGSRAVRGKAPRDLLLEDHVQVVYVLV